jgi:hypothetical protein
LITGAVEARGIPRALVNIHFVNSSISSNGHASFLNFGRASFGGVAQALQHVVGPVNAEINDD